MSGPESGTWGASFAGASVGAMQAYDAILVPALFIPWTEYLLDTVAPQAGETLLDVATGPATVARLAAARLGPTGRVVAADLSPAMLAVARAKPPVPAGAPIEFIECPADALAVPDETCDVVTCQQGLQFFPDRPAALREMHRASRPGARLGVAVWCDIEECPPFAGLHAAIDEVLGGGVALSYRRGPWGWGDGRAVAALVEQAGFGQVELRRERLPFVFEGGPREWAVNLVASGLADHLAALDGTTRARLDRAIERHLSPLMVDGRMQSYATSNVVTGTA